MPPEDDFPKTINGDLDPAVTESAVMDNIFYLDGFQKSKNKNSYKTSVGTVTHKRISYNCVAQSSYNQEISIEFVDLCSSSNARSLIYI